MSPEEIHLIARTVRRAPEVMVKVLSRGGQDLKAVGRHFSYLSRKGELEIETDDGQKVSGKGSEAHLLDDWDLDIQEQRPTSSLGPSTSHKAPKLVHKVLFSMPPGTPPKKVLEAVKEFAREEFGVKHRYAMVLHTDEAHPHVHMVVKAVSEHGARLNIRKATLREWRREFARHLRDQGVEANATERAVRGNPESPKSDGVFRAMRRGASHHMIDRVCSVGRELANGSFFGRNGSESLRRTREDVKRGWAAAAIILSRQNQSSLAGTLVHFVRQFRSPLTDREQIAGGILVRQHRYRARQSVTRE